MKFATALVLGFVFAIAPVASANARPVPQHYTFCARPVAGGPLHCWTR